MSLKILSTLVLALAVLFTACVPRPSPAPAPTAPSQPPPAPRRVPPPPRERNLLMNGGFETLEGEDPVAWKGSGRSYPGATVRVVELPEAPEGQRVAEISLAPDQPPSYGLFLAQQVRLDYRTAYDLSVWVRGIDIVSGLHRPHGFGQHCGLFFWLLGPSGDFKTKVLPGGAFPRRDGTTGWELRTMRFTTPPREAFTDRSPDGDDRLHLRLQVLLFGTGTIQVDDVRLARSTASPPLARRTPGRLALAAHSGKPFFALGLYRLPTGMTWARVAEEKVFNLGGGAGETPQTQALGLVYLTLPWTVDPACCDCSSPAGAECAYCRQFLGRGGGTCGNGVTLYLTAPGSYGSWIDEPNIAPEIQGDLEDQIAAARRIHREAARLRPFDPAYYLYSTDAPGGVYFNPYGWDDLARYHTSEAFDSVGTIRRGVNPRKVATGGTLSGFPATATNCIRQITLHLADDVTDPSGRQQKPVWMLVNGGSGRILTDPDEEKYRFAPHNPAQLLAMRPHPDQLRYMLYAAVLNGATGLYFYQDENDTLLTPEDPYWTGVLLPAAAELAALEKQTGYLTRAEYNATPYRLTGNSDGVDSMLKRVGDAWVLAVANSSPERLKGVQFVAEGGSRIEGAVERLTYRHDARPGGRTFEATPAGEVGPDHFALDLPGYGVALYRFRLLEAGASNSAAAGSDRAPGPRAPGPSPSTPRRPE